MTDSVPEGLTAEARSYLQQPQLAPLWRAARARLERAGLSAAGTVRLDGLDRAQRTALGLLMDRQFSGSRATVRLSDLDTRLRSSGIDRSLVEVLELLGPPLTDRRAVRDGARTEREEVYAEAARALAGSALADAPWAERWLNDLRRTGTLSRLAPEAAVRTARQAVRALALLDAEQPCGRGELATRVTGSAHGLDDDTVLARLVLRALAFSTGLPFPDDAPARRALWAIGGVATDEVSGTVLVHRLRPAGDGWRERALRERAENFAETQLTLRELRALDLTGIQAGTLVRVCENPRVVEAAADARCSSPLVCTSGSAATAVLTLLDKLAAAGCAFAYHGDFDWPGIALANRFFARYHAVPWRMSASDYEHLASRAHDSGTPPLPLSGPPVTAAWDRELTPAMTALGSAQHEEAALDLLLSDTA
jgi:uncharacterized protein (TIGR02679 family)